MTQLLQPVLVIVSYPNQPRNCKRLITAILKQGLAREVQCLNYVKTYTLQEGCVKKCEDKLLIIKTTTQKQDKIMTLLKKMHPSDNPDIMTFTPDSIDSDYLENIQS